MSECPASFVTAAVDENRTGEAGVKALPLGAAVDLRRYKLLVRNVRKMEAQRRAEWGGCLVALPLNRSVVKIK